ncbi:peptidoglycan-binding protein [Kovacikia minuta CCNUW1]|uniref:peptidoglycan-binding domain-containing protein n=1 Tax=Kovacikia minuta TaxID=2931930 RepID=UPI001CCD2A82|nr:peptidoglycan-binding protein [Kovacikia minuta]UBF28499.1 peptidoglycan-binding protein [Kovacikia minuta CCNUW1]
MAYSLSQFKEVLDGLGFHLGPDGLNGNNGNILDVYTQSAIREFQYQHKLPLTGRLDPATDIKAEKVMQDLQYSLNLTVDAQLPINEFYGPRTLQAVKAFQRAYGLPVTGIATLTVRQRIEQEARRLLTATA